MPENQDQVVEELVVPIEDIDVSDAAAEEVKSDNPFEEEPLVVAFEDIPEEKAAEGEEETVGGEEGAEDEAKTVDEEPVEEKAAFSVVMEDEDQPAESEEDEEEEDEETEDPKVALVRKRAMLMAQLAEVNRTLAPRDEPTVAPPPDQRAARLERMGLKSEEVGDDAILCAVERKMLPNGEPCAFCRGGCVKEDNLPGLFEIEMMAEQEYKGEVIESGYGPNDDIFVLDIKREDGKTIEAFYTGFGEAAGWVLLNQDVIDATEGKDALGGRKVISITEAEDLALKSIDGVAVSVNPAMFEGYDAYSVEIEGVDGKSYDAYVALDGTILGFDEYDSGMAETPVDDPEVKALEAELELKKAFGPDKRGEMAKEGNALPDGSFPIENVQDLKNAILAIGRAKDPSLAKAHIMKRAVQLGQEDLIPENWMPKGKKVLVDGEEDQAFMKDLLDFELLEAEIDLEDSGLL